MGYYNDPYQYNGNNRLFIVGNGTGPTSLSNAFSVSADGTAHAQTAFSTGSADFVEWFESNDGKRIPYGSSVILLPNGKIRVAKKGELPFGVISNTGAFIGNSAETEWYGKYMRAEDGGFIYEDIVVKTTDDNQPIIRRNKKISKEFDPTQKYIPRSSRPEWHTVGMLGVVKILPEQAINPNWVHLSDVKNKGNYQTWLINGLWNMKLINTIVTETYAEIKKLLKNNEITTNFIKIENPACNSVVDTNVITIKGSASIAKSTIQIY